MSDPTEYRADPPGFSAEIVDALFSGRELASRYLGAPAFAMPWRIVIERPLATYFYLLTAGQCRLALPESAPVTLAAGDLAVVFAGQTHAMGFGPSRGDIVRRGWADQAHADPHPSQGSPCGRTPPSGEVATAFMVGTIAFGAALGIARQALPPVLVVPGVDGRPADWIDRLVGLIALEAEETRSLGGPVLDRLTSVLWLRAIRTALAAGGPLPDLPAGAGRIVRAVARIHAEPARRWSVAELAGLAALSPSRFAAAFAAQVGQSPMAYVAAVRLERAAEALRRSDAAIAQVAGDAGYSCETAFSKAFRRHFGKSPGAYRRAVRSAPRQ